MLSTQEEKDPQSRSSLLIALGFLLHFLALVLSGIAFFSPFWMIELNSGYKTGLWGRCDQNEMNCIWFQERDYAWEKFIPGWHIAAQVMFSIGIGILALSFLASLGHLIFHCCKTFFKISLYIGFSILVAVLFEMISIIVFGAGAYNVYDVSLFSWLGNFIWAFYVGIAALFVCTFSALCYLAGGQGIVSDMKNYTSVYT